MFVDTAAFLPPPRKYCFKSSKEQHGFVVESAVTSHRSLQRLQNATSVSIVPAPCLLLATGGKEHHRPTSTSANRAAPCEGHGNAAAKRHHSGRRSNSYPYVACLVPSHFATYLGRRSTKASDRLVPGADSGIQGLTRYTVVATMSGIS